jgi:TonB family protein
MLIVGNDGWSIEKGEKTDLVFGVNGRVYSDGVAVGVSEKFASKKSFATKFGPEFLKDFAASPYLVILKGDVTVDRLQLRGSGAALAVAKRCLAKVRSDIAVAAAEKRKYADIADDPFAKPGAVTLSGGSAVKGGPRGNPGGWFTDDDYPADAKRAGAQGSVSLLLSVDTSGKVAGCRVTASSGNASLDDATCRLAERRGRFTVQKDSQGNAQPYTYSLPGIHWSLRGQ